MPPDVVKDPGRRRGPGARTAAWAMAAIAVLAASLRASDHADPIDPFNRERLEGGITDLFVFPILQDGRIAFPFKRTDGISIAKPDLSMRPAIKPEERAQIKGLAVIMCVRRALTESGTLNLSPYTYRVHMDLRTRVSYEDTDADKAPPPAAASDHGHDHAGEGGGYTPPPLAAGKMPKRPTGAEARARYGGIIADPAKISDDVLIEFTLKDDAKLNKMTVVKGLKNADKRSLDKADPNVISTWTGVRDDPFIFPAFFGTNIVAMVMTIPISSFPEGQQDWLIWGTSHKGSRQVNHVGRSLRTQNPRFELLNTLPPSEHVAAILEEHEHPGLLRDIALRLNLQSMFAYRNWDNVPDVMVYTNRYPVGFPNGRMLTDDVAALLAQHGDTLLLELSHQHQNGAWPRRTTNDKPFHDTFPYLADPWPDHEESPPPKLTAASWMKIGGIAIALILLLLLENWLVAIWYYRRKIRRRYL